MKLTERSSPEQIQQWLKEIPTYPDRSPCPDYPYPNKYRGRGIVMVAGGPNYGVNAYASIRLLRDKGCALPIQCFYLGEDEKVPEIEDALMGYGVEFVDAYDLNRKLEHPHTHLQGWEAKPFSIIHSRFEDVLYLDADVFVDGDPEYIFDSSEYKEHQAIYMPDFNKLGENRSFWRIFDLEYRDEPEIESGIVFINKKKCWDALNMANKICEYGTRYYFNHFHGDKESFHAAHLVTNTPYYQEKTPIKKLSGTMLQHWQGKPLFYHRNMEKLNLLHNKQVRNFANEDKLFGYLKELRDSWSPFYPEGEGLSGRWKYTRLGLDTRVIEIEGHVITRKSAKMEKYVSKIDAETLYIMDEDGKITCEMEPWKEGWIGRWRNFERCVCVLHQMEKR